MKVIILTESDKGTAAHHLPYLLQSPTIEVVQIVRSKGIKPGRRKFLFKKIRKSLKIGILGTLNGFRMRKWFGENINQQLQLKSLDQICKEHKIPYAEVEVTNSDDTIKIFRKAEADIGVSLGSSFISKKVFSIPKLGMINIHHEILPDYQNAQSIIWQLYNSSVETGFTIHSMTSKIDGGDILFQQKVPIVFKEKISETIAATSLQLLKASANGLVQLLQNFDRYAKDARQQGPGNVYTTPSFNQFLRILRNFNRLKKDHAGR